MSLSATRGRRVPAEESGARPVCSEQRVHSIPDAAILCSPVNTGALQTSTRLEPPLSGVDPGRHRTGSSSSSTAGLPGSLSHTHKRHCLQQPPQQPLRSGHQRENKSQHTHNFTGNTASAPGASLSASIQRWRRRVLPHFLAVSPVKEKTRSARKVVLLGHGGPELTATSQSARHGPARHAASARTENKKSADKVVLNHNGHHHGRPLHPSPASSSSLRKRHDTSLDPVASEVFVLLVAQHIAGSSGTVRAGVEATEGC
ncbi:unnamed protein product [Pleuronectes platessa]|uniref:Uncharacterized protein n=1 Tax=Pleuronectes platessa TaxID=8262 RepID=A0A9N7UN99_PLEPL|nr:unnamed protein product [Pleuronectes platessa]